MTAHPPVAGWPELADLARPQSQPDPAPLVSDATLRRTADTLARTIHGEARGESVRGKEAVASVVMNRVRRARTRGGYWWGGTVEAVCRKPYQFSCWNAGDPNRAVIEAVGSGDADFAVCQRIARRAIRDALRDPTRGATHYHAKGISPPWSRGHSASAEIGRHLFYNDIT